MPEILGRSIHFPDPVLAADARGMVAAGGDLSPERLLAAYRRGIFPWSVKPVTWWSPDPRGIFELDQFHVSRNLARVMARGSFSVTRNQAFAEVIKHCAAPAPNRPGHWITPEFIAAYTQLHRLGHAHSVECWQNGELAGGIYGVATGGLFAGESMFHHVSNASKVALCHLAHHLRDQGFLLFDIQMVTSATRPMGAVEISRLEYLQRLAVALTR
ncbi:MAG TPA: leucyl/phenylalanyl-tRNA--protein transferase, partial [Candidatus Acidoferrales bacterium]|nr:leucyl/phenylalanyl-tRNA--protein transferase [Candidatus Acidoferrales bacterium]